MNLPQPIYPGVFEIIDLGKHQYDLKYISNRFKVPNRLYGIIPKYIEYFWSRFVKRKYTGGLLLTGSAGAGKTEIAKVISNKAIAVGMRVVYINGIRYSPELISYLDTLDGVVLFFDEFAKNFYWSHQEKMLTLLSNTMGKEKIVIITENNPSSINQFIRNRPGRIRYRLHFDKLPISTLEEFCAEYPINKNFYNDLLELYESAKTFTFDHMKAIVEEHIDTPDMPLKELVKLLNLENLSGEKYFIPVKIINKEEKELKFKATPDKVSYDDFVQGYKSISFNIIKEEDENQNQNQPMQQPGGFIPFNNNNHSITVNQTHITKLLDDEMVAEIDDYTITFNIEEKRS